jgi:hypothetical protein
VNLETMEEIEPLGYMEQKEYILCMYCELYDGFGSTLASDKLEEECILTP